MPKTLNTVMMVWEGIACKEQLGISDAVYLREYDGQSVQCLKPSGLMKSWNSPAGSSAVPGNQIAMEIILKHCILVAHSYVFQP